MHTKNNKAFERVHNMFCKNDRRENLRHLKAFPLRMHLVSKLIGLVFLCLFNVIEPISSMQIQRFDPAKKDQTELASTSAEAFVEILDALRGRGNLLVYHSLKKIVVVLGSFSQVKKIDTLAGALAAKSPVIKLSPLESILLAGNIVRPTSLAPALVWSGKIGEFIDRLGNPAIFETHKEEFIVAIQSAEMYTQIVADVARDETTETDPIRISIKDVNACRTMQHIWHQLTERAAAKALSPEEIEITRSLLMVGYLDEALQGLKVYAPKISAYTGIPADQVKMAIGWWAKAMHTEVQMLALSRAKVMAEEIRPLPTGSGVLSWLNPCQPSCRPMIESTHPQELLPFLYFKEDEQSRKK